MNALRPFMTLYDKVKVSLVAILVAGVCATPESLAQTQAVQGKDSELEQEKQTVTQLEDEWLNALNTANVKVLSQILADDFVRPAPDYGQFVTKADILSFYRSHLRAQASDHKQIENMTLTVYGSTVLARGVLTTTNAEGQIIRRLLFTDVFLKRDGKWQAVSAQENVVPIPTPPAH